MFRFIIVEENINYNVVYEKNTKVMYVISMGEHNHGNFTMLVNKYGKPLLYRSGE